MCQPDRSTVAVAFQYVAEVAENQLTPSETSSPIFCTFPLPSRSAVPMFLTTKLLPRSDGDLAKNTDLSEEIAGSRSHIEAVERFNESVDDIASFFNDAVASDATLGKLALASKR